MKNRILFSLLSVVFVLSAPSAFAQKIVDQYKRPMPKVEAMPVAEFEQKTKAFQNTRVDKEAVKYEMRVPTVWTESSKGNLGMLSVTDKILGEVGKFYGPPSLTTRSRVVVEGIGLDYDMTAEQWFIQYLMSNGYNVQGFKVYDKKRAEALYVMIEDGISMAVRSVAQVNGKYVVFAQYFVPTDRYHDEKAMQVGVLDSFKVLKPSDEFVEEMTDYLFLDIAKFQYPASWKLRAVPIRSIDRMKVELFNVSEIEVDYGKFESKLDGKIDLEMVSVFASETLEEEIERYRKDLAEKGLTLGEIIESKEDFVLDPIFDFVDTQVYAATDKDNNLVDHELWLTIMSSGEYYYFLSLFTPSRDHDYFLWSRNTETFKLIAGLTKPHDGQYQ